MDASQLVRGWPYPESRGLVLGYSGYAQRGAEPMLFVEPPGGLVPLIVDSSDDWRISDRSRWRRHGGGWTRSSPA